MINHRETSCNHERGFLYWKHTQKAFLLQMYCFTSSIPVLNCVPEPHHVSVYVGWTSTARHLEETTWNRPMQREREDYAIPIPYWATPTFIKHSRAPQSDSTPDVFEGGEKDHLCLIKVYIKIILILIIHQQKRIARGPHHSQTEMSEMSSV